MARPSPWNSPTVAVRIPAHAREQLLAIARQLDTPPVSYKTPEKTLVTIDEARYILETPELSPTESAQVDAACDRFLRLIPKESDRLLAFMLLTQRTQTPL